MKYEIGSVVQISEELEWKIPDFFSLSTEATDWYNSPNFSFAGEFWFLSYFPNQSRANDTEVYIRFSLARYATGLPIRLEFSICLKSFQSKKIEEKYTDHTFKEKRMGCGWSFFMSRSELIARRSELLPSDILTIICTIKCSKSAEDKIEPCTSSSCNIFRENKLFHDFKDFFLRKENCDVVLRVQGQEFPAHKAILEARSPVLASTFRNDMKEKATGVVDIEDCDPSSFSDFICFLYCADIDVISKENVFSLYTVADKYDVQDLREACVEFMKKNLSVDTFCETITLSLRHYEAQLIKLTTDFFIKNAKEITLTVKWQTFLAENPTESNELILKLIASSQSCFYQLREK